MTGDRALMDQDQGMNLKVNLDKCEIRRTETVHVGHVQSAERVKPDQDKVRAVEDMPEQEDKADLLRFLEQFVPNL